ncbi:MAG: hypothetical protein PUB69_00240 [Desulfovibrionaceae bacterium]|nr:hypothetical protein [Desulfovibrionaceae bacterium]
MAILEEELKNRVRNDYFSDFENSLIIGKIDFCISQKLPDMDYSFLWAEAKKGNSHDIYESFIQLIMTIGRARTIDSYSPPVFLGAFDAQKMAFLEYYHIMEIFSKSDFNWNVTPSDHSTKEFQDLSNLLRKDLQKHIIVYDFDKESNELRQFIRDNFKVGRLSANKIAITKNNFVSIYYKWREKVRPSINIPWDKVKTRGIVDADFYLADILSRDNASIKEKLYVLLKSNMYYYNKQMDDDGLLSFKYAQFNDGQVAHTQFWNRYTRPPREEFWDYVIDRRDLLVEQDIRERKGAFYTPLKWVELSQKYMADYFGDNYQDEYYIWDCAAGTGNLLNGLTNKYRIFASTLDQADVDILKERSRTAKTLLEENIFQFDFLNDSFEKCPKELQDIIADEEKRKRLIIYINPPYAEATSSKSIVNKETHHKKGVSGKSSYVYTKYSDVLGRGVNELFVQFLIRIYKEIKGSIIAHFSTLKIVLSANFIDFRDNFNATLDKIFIVPANTFDNVKGNFPIGFYIWDTTFNNIQQEIMADVYDSDVNLIQYKRIVFPKRGNFIINWIQNRYDKINERIAYLVRGASDFQNNKIVFITISPSNSVLKNSRTNDITVNNIIENSIFYTVRHVIKATWLNDRDQYLYPNSSWEQDEEFKTDCFAYTLFNNNIQSEHGINHWIPFTEQEVEPRRAFESHFMTDYMKGRLKPKTSSKTAQGSLIAEDTESRVPTEPLVFSDEAKAVFDAGRELWKYYHSKPDSNPNAALYDIKEYFQKRNEKGRLNKSSKDETYNKLMDNLRDKLKILAAKIEPKVYEHGFLLK